MSTVVPISSRPVRFCMKSIALEQAFPGRVDSGILQKILSDGPVPLEQKVPDIDPELSAIVRKPSSPMSPALSGCPCAASGPDEGSPQAG